MLNFIVRDIYLNELRASETVTFIIYIELPLSVQFCHSLHHENLNLMNRFPVYLTRIKIINITLYEDF